MRTIKLLSMSAIIVGIAAHAVPGNPHHASEYPGCGQFLGQITPTYSASAAETALNNAATTCKNNADKNHAEYAFKQYTDQANLCKSVADSKHPNSKETRANDATCQNNFKTLYQPWCGYTSALQYHLQPYSQTNQVIGNNMVVYLTNAQTYCANTPDANGIAILNTLPSLCASSQASTSNCDQLNTCMPYYNALLNTTVPTSPTPLPAVAPVCSPPESVPAAQAQ